MLSFLISVPEMNSSNIFPPYQFSTKDSKPQERESSWNRLVLLPAKGKPDTKQAHNGEMDH